MSEELPYKTEYAKSGRAGCKGCKLNIGLGTLRLAVMVQVFNTISNYNNSHQSQRKINVNQKFTRQKYSMSAKE